jgi:hypothetical protein
VAGVGYDTRLLNGKVLDDLGTGTIASVIQGITWATDHGAQVINLSLGANLPCTSALQETIDATWARQVVIVAAAGNDTLSTPHLPASCSHVLAVASTDATDTKSAFSSHGSWVDVAAPGGRDAAGRGILSTDYIGGYVAKSGTSMAAPHVAGLAALLWSMGGTTTAQAIVERITGTADAIAGTGVFWQYGRVSAAAALAQALTAPGSAGPQGALAWYFAEGYTGDGFDEYLILFNPNLAAALVTITYYLGDGPTRTTTLSLAGGRRMTVAVHEAGQGVGRGQAVAARVVSTNGVGIVAERSMYFTYRSSAGPITGGHAVLGATAPARAWYFAEGYTGPGFDEYLTLLNPHDDAAAVTITYTTSAGSPPATTVTVPARGRTTIAVHEQAQGVGRDQAVAVRVTTTHSDGIVAERSLYFAYGRGITGGHASLGATQPAQDWYFAEGYTADGFDEYLAILNPGAQTARVTITYALGDGTSQSRQTVVAAGRRLTVAVHDPIDGVGRGQAVAAHVTTTSPEGIVVERPMYFAYAGSAGVVTGGHTVLGAPRPRQRWLFAEGYTGPGFDEYLTIFNPAVVAVPVAITYTLGDGTLRTRLLNVAGRTRATVAVHDPAAGVGRGQVVAAQVMTTSAQGIVVERPMYFTYRVGVTGGHVVLGTN